MKIILLFVLGVFFSCSSFHKIKDTKLKLRILHTNDHHGHYLADRHDQAGMAARKTLLDQLRQEIKKENGKSLLLSGGDINTGTMESDIFDAEPDFKGMKRLGYDAMAIGNHEFDNAYNILLKQKQWAGFPFLSANIYWKGTDKRVFNPLYIIKEIQGIKIGIFGLTTKDTPFKASHDDAKAKFDFRPIIDAAKEVVQILKEKEKVDLVIVATHVGHDGSLTSNGDVELAKAVDGIDVIVGGHSQEIINAEEHNDTVIVQAEDWGKYIGVLDLYIGKDHKKHAHDYKLRPVNMKKKINGKYVYMEKQILPNKEMNTFFKPFRLKAEKLGNKVIGSIDRSLVDNRTNVRSSQCAIGQFMGDALMEQVKGVDVAIINGGSIRSSINKGKVTRKDLHNVHPYGNAIITVEMTAEELFNYVQVIADEHMNLEKGYAGGYPQLINMKLTFDKRILMKIESPRGDWSISNINGKINANKNKFIYSTLNFLAKGGDNYPKLIHKPTYVDTGFMINAAMLNLIYKNKTLNTEKYHQLVK